MPNYVSEINAKKVICPRTTTPRKKSDEDNWPRILRQVASCYISQVAPNHRLAISQNYDSLSKIYQEYIALLFRFFL